MAIISTDDLEAGMELQQPVKNLQGQLLFGAGHVILEKHINMMMAWGIPEADVKIEEEEDDEAELKKKEMWDQAVAMIQPKFCRCDLEDPVVKEIFRFCTERQVSIHRGKGGAAW